MNKLKSITPAFALLVLLLSGCIKPKDDTMNDTDVTQHNEDVNNTKRESDNLNTDIQNILNNAPGFKKKEGVAAYDICGASVDDSQQYATIPTLTVTFDGTTACGNPSRTRSGKVKIELIEGNAWGEANSKLRITHTNYKVVLHNLDDHYLTFNGTKYLTNLVQINWLTYAQTGSLQTQLRERSYDMKVTFENGEQESWNCARRTDLNITGYSNISVTVNGDTTINGKIIDSWGRTRFNTDFLTEMVVPWKSGTTCGWWRPTQGKYTSTTTNFTVTATAGVNQNGVPVTSGCSAYGYLLEWRYSSGSTNADGEFVVNYF